ncbi:proton pump-interactor 1 isoform X1 [Cryptomeria japonica]|uniref:proton pump-interactor 1 isoform X1 n=1 Tax=Cryptomeria japonica TaxID=3369 RepID=UPI0027DA5FF6|nr:proton pump-interactor 1 isoform X1 [Cryptomeria japonica]XP_057857275.2 proton pump-interactor 1 isoform X1 [Cryptomeria japonica]XP_057857277.2 proton pump-interactor 1 isoform X1 [Cryptomeria japonica]
MGVEIVGSEYVKDQTISKLVNVDEEKTIKLEANDMKAFSGFEAAEAPTGANESLNVQDQKQETVIDNGIPVDVKDEWPAPAEVHQFYMVKFRSYDDPQLKSKLDQADKDLQKKSQARYQITEALRAKRSERAEVIEKLKPLTSTEKVYRKSLEEKKKELEPLQTALGKFRNANVASRERGQGLCSSEEELNRRIHNLQFRIEHDNNTLPEEKQMIREIKQLENTREKVIAHEAMQAKLQDSMGEKELIQDRFKVLGEDLDALRKEQQGAWSRIKPFEEDLRVIDEKLSTLQEELAVATEKREKAAATVFQLKNERDAANASYFQYRAVLTIAKDLASKKDTAGLEEFSQNEVEKFTSLWKSSSTFREDYIKKTSPFLYNRQLSKDGRTPNPDEKFTVPDGGEGLGSNFGRENQKKETVNSKASKTLADRGLPNSNGDSKENIQIIGSGKGKVSSKPSNTHESETAVASDVIPNDKPTTYDEEDAVIMKEKKREEEIAKAKLAQERKKRQAEKALAKAAVKAQKEAEKKMKEREKRTRRRASATQPSESEVAANIEAEAANDADEPEPKISEDTEQQKEVESNNKIRSRKRDFTSKSKVKASFPKSALKKKQTFPIWVWAGVAVLIVFLLFAIGYYYVL